MVNCVPIDQRRKSHKIFEVDKAMATLHSGRTIGATIEVDPPTSIIHSEPVSRWDINIIGWSSKLKPFEFFPDDFGECPADFFRSNCQYQAELLWRFFRVAQSNLGSLEKTSSRTVASLKLGWFPKNSDRLRPGQCNFMPQLGLSENVEKSLKIPRLTFHPHCFHFAI